MCLIYHVGVAAGDCSGFRECNVFEPDPPEDDVTVTSGAILFRADYAYMITRFCPRFRSRFCRLNVIPDHNLF